MSKIIIEKSKQEADDLEKLRKRTLVEDFNKQFKSKADDYDLVMKVLTSRAGQKWYRNWKEDWSAKTSVPQELVKIGISPLEWQQYMENTEERKEKRKEYQKKLDDLQDKYTSEKMGLEASLSKELQNTETIVSRIKEFNRENLEPTDLLKIEMISDKTKRESEQNKMIEEKRIELYKKLKAMSLNK